MISTTKSDKNGYERSRRICGHCICGSCNIWACKQVYTDGVVKMALQYSNLTNAVEKDIEGTISIPIGAAVGQKVTVQFANNPEIPSQLDNYYLTPSSENDVLFGVYLANSTLEYDGYLGFSVDDVNTNIIFGKLNPTWIGQRNPVQFDHEMLIAHNGKLEVSFIMGTTNASGSVQTENVEFRLMRAPLGMKTIVIPKR